MLFNSYIFLFLFLPLTLTGYFATNKYLSFNLSKLFLVFMSLYFYGYFNPKYLIIIVCSIIINFLIGNNLSFAKKFNKNFLFISALIFNIGILGYFKYYDFFLSNINYIFKTNFSLLNLILPLGISFFTFQQLSFIVDSYNKKVVKYDFLSYCLFVTFFPQLIAGPIVLPDEMLPQFENKHNKSINFTNLNKGLYIFSIGLGKKILIADSIAPFADNGFDKLSSLTFFEGWITSLSYTMQLYFDFSGYCDMAIGIALMFNIILPLNFNSPYKSTNIQEFWKRWHITLGRFLTTYLYIPLGGNRVSNFKTLKNLLLVFLVSGIWHGAGWNFILWGALHGISIIVHRIWKSFNKSLPKLLGWLITFNIINIFWIFFRAKSLNDAFKVLTAMFNVSSIRSFVTNEYLSSTNTYLGNSTTFFILFIALVIALFFKNSQEKNNNTNSFLWRIEFFLFSTTSILFLERIASFLYFNF
ncbi:MAG: MBOAT family O-acyltransferase [Cetobacterium sp.]